MSNFDLKDFVLSTLAEIENNELPEKPINNISDSKFNSEKEPEINKLDFHLLEEESFLESEKTIFNKVPETEILDKESNESLESLHSIINNNEESESQFLTSIQERISTLFEGLKSDEMRDKDKKIDITLKYLEYLIISIDDRLDFAK